MDPSYPGERYFLLNRPGTLNMATNEVRSTWQAARLIITSILLNCPAGHLVSVPARVRRPLPMATAVERVMSGAGAGRNMPIPPSRGPSSGARISDRCVPSTVVR
ncbi:unnamed protein product [Boreogadus saida]